MPRQMYELRPLDGIGPIRLGMTREEARKAMGQTPKSFRKLPLFRAMTDAYHASTFQVFFNEREKVEFIELSRDDEIGVTFQGTDLLRTPAEKIVALLHTVAEFDPNNPELGYSYTFPKLELAVWRPVIPEYTGDSEGNYFSTVGIGERGYYSGNGELC